MESYKNTLALMLTSVSSTFQFLLFYLITSKSSMVWPILMPCILSICCAATCKVYSHLNAWYRAGVGKKTILTIDRIFSLHHNESSRYNGHLLPACCQHVSNIIRISGLGTACMMVINFTSNSQQLSCNQTCFAQCWMVESPALTLIQYN